MGCGASKEDIEKYKALVIERDLLALEKADLVRKIKLLEENIIQAEIQSNEQLNLYRFKIEVLVQMLAIEEKKQQTLVKRLEILKLALLNQGVSNQTMTNILSQSVDQSSPKDEKSILLTSAFDLTGALGRMSEEMKNGAEDIIFSFADSEGKIVSALPREDFMRFLYNATDKLTKSDVQILSLRFYDGQTVCVPEFIDFFTQSSNSRVARSATAAVRASLNLLQLRDEPHEDNESSPLTIRTPSERIQTNQHLQTRLSLAVQRLVSVWHRVGEILRCEFNDLEQNVGGGHVITLDTFKEVLSSVINQERTKEAKNLEKNSRRNPYESLPDPTPWPNEDDINLIASRFELGNRIDMKVFFDFFQDERMATGTFTCEQFKFSQEWSTLRRSTKRDLVQHDSSQTGSDGDEPPRAQSKWEVARNARKQLAVIGAMKKSVPGKTDSKPPLGRQSPELPPLSPREAPQPEVPETNRLPAPLVKRKSSKLSQQSLVITYSKDPTGFEQELERRVASSGYLFTKVALKSNLIDLCPLTKEKEIDAFVNDLRYPGGTVSTNDVINLLKARWNEMSQEHQESEKMTDLEQRKNIEVSKTAISSRENTIIALKQQAMLDPITLNYKTDPKVFVAELTKMTEAGKGTALTKDQLSRGIRSLIPTVPLDIEDTLIAELSPKFRSKTNDILITSVTALLKERMAASAKIEKQIAIEEKALVVDRARSKRMEERAVKIERLKEESKVDRITTLYKLHPTNFKKFFDKYSIEQKGKAIRPDELKTILQSVVIDATELEIDTLKTELTPQVDLKTNQLPIAAIIANLKTKSDKALKIYKELQKEEKAQAKDADEAAGKKSGGFCGGSSKDVHDPSKAPQAAPPNTNTPTNTAPTNIGTTTTTTPNPNPAVAASSPAPALARAPSPELNSQPSAAPNSQKNMKMLRNSTRDTVDTLTYSEGGDDKEEDAARSSGLSRWSKNDGIGFTEPKKPQRIQRIRKSSPQDDDDDSLGSGSQQSADLFDSDDNEDGDPFASMEKKR